MYSIKTPPSPPSIFSSNYYYSLKNIFLFLFLIAAIFSLAFFSSFPSKFPLPPLQSLKCPRPLPIPPPPDTALKIDELQQVLDKTSMKNKTVIIAVVNSAYVQGEVYPNMLDLFLEGFWVGDGTRELVDHLMVVAVDQTAYNRCIFRGLHCYRLVTDGVDYMAEKVFMSDAFIKMMWRRTLFLLDILKRGYNFIFTDTDVIWLRNPFHVLSTNTTQHFDVQFSIDKFYGNSTSSFNPINTGFYYVKSNNKTISLFETWYGLKDNAKGFKEQDVLQNLTWSGVLNQMGLNVRFVDTRYFSGFCEVSRDIWSVVTVHANCCRFISAKVADLKGVLHDWARFKHAPANVTKDFRWAPHINCIKSWQENVH